MIELVLLIPLFIVGLVLFYYVDMRQPQPDTPEALMEQVKGEAIDEMKSKIIFYYGNQKVKEKKLYSYEDFYEEYQRIERKQNAE